MAKDASFDIVSEIDIQVIDDVVNVSQKEIANRFDLKGTGAEITFDRSAKKITFHAQSEFQVKQLKDILKQKMAKREVSAKALSPKPIEKASHDMVKEHNDLVCGIDKEMAKKIIKDIKGLKLKVQATIQDEQIRISGKSRDDLQEVIKFIREKDYPVPLQFTNFR